MPATVLRWSFGNAKLTRTDTISFNLPAFEAADGFRVCPGAGVCRMACYARQGRYMLPNSIAAREVNLDIVRSSLPLFERLAIADLKRIPNDTIRIHDSGDFFSQAYLESWFRICVSFPDKRFYAYTKSLHLCFDAKPANLRIVQSMGGIHDAQIDQAESHTRIFVTHKERKAAGYMDGTKTDRPAMEGRTRIGFVYHGSRPISLAVARYLRKDQR
jgi:hypothetical protein